MGGATCSERLYGIDRHNLGGKTWPVVTCIYNSGVATKQGLLKYYFLWRWSWTKVSGRYRQGGRLSGVAVKRVYTSTIIYASMGSCATCSINVQACTCITVILKI